MKNLKYIFPQVKFYSSLLNRKSLIRLVNLIFKKYILGRKILEVAVIGITYECQCKCVHCSAWPHHLSWDKLTLDEWKKVIDSLAQLGAFRLHFSGGEPLLSENLVELIKYAYQKGFIIFLETNGLLLNMETAKVLKEAGVTSINISIDSADSGEHDRLRGVDGCFFKALEAVKICRYLKITHIVSTYATKAKIYSGDLAEVIKTAIRLRVPALRILHPQPSGRWLNNLSLRLNQQDRKWLKGKIISKMPFFSGLAVFDRTDLATSKCLIKQKYTIYIAPDGEVSPCPYLPFSFGNFRENSLRELLNKMSTHPMFQSTSICYVNDADFRKKYIEPILTNKSNLSVRIRWRK